MRQAGKPNTFFDNFILSCLSVLVFIFSILNRVTVNHTNLILFLHSNNFDVIFKLWFLHSEAVCNTIFNIIFCLQKDSYCYRYSHWSLSADIKVIHCTSIQGKLSLIRDHRHKKK